MDKYLTISGENIAEYSEKRSRFIAKAVHCENEAEAIELISDVRAKYWDAKHNVYAYVLKNGIARFSDDGEPHGTAGKPLLDVLRGSGVVDALITVTRYFGGVLLGTGGLVRAYSVSAQTALSGAKAVEMCPATEISVKCGYSDHNKLISLIENSFGIIENTNFTDEVQVVFSLKNEYLTVFKNKLCEGFSARLEANVIGKKYFSFEIEK